MGELRRGHARTIAFGAIAAAVAAVVRVPGLIQPIGPDQGILITIGQRITEGYVPYRDMWEMASPGIFYAFALFVQIFGTHMWVPAAVDMIVCACSAFLMVVLGRLLWSGAAGLFAGLLYAVFSYSNSIALTAAGEPAFGTYWFLAQRETFMTTFILVAVILHVLIIRRPRLWLLIPYGAAWGMAFLFKFPIGLLIFFAGLHLYFELLRREPNWGRRLVQFHLINLCMALGFLAIQAPFFLVVIFQGAGAEMNEAMFGYVKEIYAGEHAPLSIVVKFLVERTALILRDGLFLWGLMLAGIAYGHVRRDPDVLLMVGWLAATALVVLAHREFHGYHYLLLIPPAAIMAAYALQVLLLESGTPFRQRLSTLEPGLVIVLAFFLLTGIVYVANNFKLVTKTANYLMGTAAYEPGTADYQEVEDKYFGYFSAWPEHDFSFPGSYAALEYIEEHSEPDDRFFVYGGIESFMHYLSDRPLASRFIYSWHLFRTNRRHTPLAVKYREEILHDLSANPPRYLLVVGGLKPFEEFTDHVAFIRNHYELVEVFPDDRYLYEHVAGRGAAETRAGGGQG